MSQLTLSGPVLNAKLDHPLLCTEIGEPAALPIGERYPALHIEPLYDGTISAVLIAEKERQVVAAGAAAAAGTPIVMQPEGTLETRGTYRYDITFTAESLSTVFLTVYFTAAPQEMMSQLQPVFLGKEGKLVYVPDCFGNTIPDFSGAGYRGGGVRLPEVPVQVELEAPEGDAGALIQAAIDKVAAMPADGQGFRGTVLLKKGVYRIEGSISIRTSGIVLRGEGTDESGTVLLGTGDTRRTLVIIEGESGAVPVDNTETDIADLYVPVGARSFRVNSAYRFQVGDSVLIKRRGNEAFIQEIGMDRILQRPTDPNSTKQWQPFDLLFDRVITEIDGNRITVDAPITCPIESRWGGGTIALYTDDGRIQNVGVENLRGRSEFDPTVTVEEEGTIHYVDENHAGNFITFHNVKNGWVRDFTAANFGFDVVTVKSGSKWITIQDGANESMVSVVTGGRRSPFSANGQCCLFQRLTSREDRHAFVLGARVCGPNVFLHCSTSEWYNTIEPHQRWSVGGLFDNVGGSIAIQDRQYYGSGHGWSGAFYTAWNTSGELVVQKPPTAQNWSFGHVGAKGKEAFPPREQGAWISLGQHVEPQSLYLQQLKERLGEAAVEHIR